MDDSNQKQGVGYVGGVPGMQAGAQVRKSTPADQVRENAERAVARLSGLHSLVESLRDRLCGSVPSNTASAREARDTINGSGFIGGTGSAVERAHIEITEIEGVLSAISEMI